MKQIVLLIALLSIVGCYRQRPLPYKTTEPTLVLNGDSGYITPTPEYSLKLRGDSGYVSKRAGHEFLLKYSLTDSTNFYWQNNISDTIGKYYYIKQTGRYYVYIMDYKEEFSFETSIVAEVTAKGGLMQYERYLHGNYPRCLENYADGFWKHGDNFIVKICGTGSGYGATYMLLFNSITPRDSLELIPLSYWSQMLSAAGEDLSSTIDLRANKLTIHYQLQTGDYN